MFTQSRAVSPTPASTWAVASASTQSLRRAASERIATSATGFFFGAGLAAVEDVAAGEEAVGDRTHLRRVRGRQRERDGRGVADVAGGDTGGPSYLLGGELLAPAPEVAEPDQHQGGRR